MGGFQQNITGKEAVFDRVSGGDGFSFGSARAGGEFGVFPVSLELFVRYGLGFGVGVVRGKGVRISLPDGVVIQIGSRVAHMGPFIENVFLQRGGLS